MKKIAISLITASLMLLNSCTTDSVDRSVEQQPTFTFDGVTENGQAHVCLDILPEATEGDVSGKALVKSKLWNNGQTITVRFLGGSADLQDRILAVARTWEQYANLKFQEVTSGNADIRISIVNDGSSWSYIGTDATRVNQNSPTMNFGWFTDNTSNSELQRTTLHEFGHALGAIHEHSSPVADIQWDVEAVYEQYALYGWSESDVNNNLFSTYNSSQTTNSAYDPLSIMHYPINNNLTLNNYSVGYNTELSPLDKEFIGITYPFDEGTNEPTTPEPTEPVTNPTNSGDNVALGRPTSQSSTGFSGVSSRAVDGNTNGEWRNSSVTHTNTENGSWWKVDFDETTSIDRIVIYNRTDCCTDRLSNFYVEVLNESDRVVGSLLVRDEPNPSFTINGNGISAKSLRIRLADVNPLSLAEVQVIKR